MQTIKKKEFYEGEKSDIDNKLSKSENEIKILKTQISNLKRNLGDLEAKKKCRDRQSQETSGGTQRERQRKLIKYC